MRAKSPDKRLPSKNGSSRKIERLKTILVFKKHKLSINICNNSDYTL